MVIIMNLINVDERSILNVVKKICTKNILDKDFVIDMTIGNGYDTLFLAKLVPNGYVFGFDIQNTAINNTDNLLKQNNISNYQLFLENHENIDITLKNYKKKISLILFNLGYLPGGNKDIMTNYKSTLQAVIKGLDMLTKTGIMLIVFYPHEEGIKEANYVKEYLNTNNIDYNEYHNTSNTYAPYLVEINKRTN